MKYALITGASSGIGLALARKFGRQKHNLILVARRKEKLEEIAAALTNENDIDVKVMTTDLSESNAASKLHKHVSELGLDVEILVNNAGRGHTGEFCDQYPEQMKGTMELNMVSLALLTRLFLQDMKSKDNGRILNVASIAGFMPGPGFALYHATKAFVLSLSEALNAEFSSSGVSVTASCPGPTESEFHQHADTLNLKSFKLLSLMDAETVADEAYQAMMAGRPYVIHGTLNQLMAVSPKVLPRKVVPKVVKTLMVK